MKTKAVIDTDIGLSNTPDNTQAYSWRATGWLFVAVALVHHPVLWIDHVLWDEISFEKMSTIGDLSGKAASLAAQGVGVAYPFYVVFSHFSEPTRMLRLCSFLSVWIIAVTVYRALRLRVGLPTRQAGSAALFLITYPAYQMYANAGAAIYVIHTAIFMLAVDCYLRVTAGPASRRWWLVAATGLWIISFTFQPLLVYFYAFFAALALSRSLGWWLQFWRDTPQRTALARIHILLWATPPAHYFLQKLLFPQNPYFANWYSSLHLNFSANMRDGLVALDSSLLTPFRNLVSQSLASWLTICATGLLLAGLSRLRARSLAATEGGHTSIATVRLFLVGLVLLSGALFPFIITGKPPAPVGPETRYSLLVIPTMAVLAAAAIVSLARIKSRLGGFIAAFCGWSLLAGFTLLHARNYVDWQAAAIKDHAIIAALHTVAPPARVNFFIIKGRNLEQRYVRRHYDWGYLFHRSWGGYDCSGEMADRLGPTNRHYYTPIGISREKMANFREWMGYGSPGPPDLWCEIEFYSAPDFAFDTPPWTVVATDLRLRFSGRKGAREAWMRHFISSVSMSPPYNYNYGAEGLKLQAFNWATPRGWIPALSRLPVSIEPAGTELYVHPSITGRFSVLPLKKNGFTVRCDALPEKGGPAIINIELRPVEPFTSDTRGNQYGIACQVHAFGSASPPRIFLVTPGQEIEGVPPRPGLEDLEAWGATPPLRSWIIWTAHSVGETTQIQNLRFGSIEAKSQCAHSNQETLHR